MPPFIVHVFIDYIPKKLAGLHASLQQNFYFVPVIVVVPGPPPSVPTQQIVIVSASICEVSYGGSR